jgi:hypothetical protein
MVMPGGQWVFDPGTLAQHTDPSLPPAPLQ